MDRPNEPRSNEPLLDELLRPEHPVTRELPRVPPAASSGGATQLLSAPAGPQPTGPVGYLPEPPAPAAEPARPVGGSAGGRRRRPPDRAAMAALALAAVAVVLLQTGLLLAPRGASSFWSTVPLWSGFATLAALLTVPSVVGRWARHTRAGTLGAGGLAGLAVFWLLVVLPVADTDRGFVLTAALACLGAAFRLAPDRAG